MNAKPSSIYGARNHSGRTAQLNFARFTFQGGLTARYKDGPEPLQKKAHQNESIK